MKKEIVKVIDYLKENKKTIDKFLIPALALTSLPILGSYLGYNKIHSSYDKKRPVLGLFAGIMTTTLLALPINMYKERCLEDITINKNVSIKQYMKFERPINAESSLKNVPINLLTNFLILATFNKDYNNEVSKVNIKTHDLEDVVECNYFVNEHLNKNFDITKLTNVSVSVNYKPITGVKGKEAYNEICLKEIR